MRISRRAFLCCMGALVAGTIAGCSDGGNGPDGSEPIGPIGPIPSDLTGKVALATSQVITTSSGSHIESRIHVVDMADPADLVIYTVRDAQIEGLTWAPDGEHLVMQSWISQPLGPNGENRDIRQLHRLTVGGTEDVVILDGSGPEFHPASGTDGRLAYFAGWSADPASGIRVDGSPVYSLFWGSGSYVAWAADGHALFYTGGPLEGLARLALPGNTVTQIVAPEGGEMITELAVSPDGARLAFIRFGGSRNNQEIWVTAATGADPRSLVAGSGDGSPAWTPGGAYVAFSRLGGSSQGIYVVPPRGGAPRRIIGVASGAMVMAWSR